MGKNATAPKSATQRESRCLSPVFLARVIGGTIRLQGRKNNSAERLDASDIRSLADRFGPVYFAVL
jgi:hypothetical protein